jgi:hypothetical protein
MQSHVYFKNLSAGNGGFDPKALGPPEIIVVQARCSSPGSSPSDMAAAVLKWQDCVHQAQSRCTVSYRNDFLFEQVILKTGGEVSSLKMLYITLHAFY